jgi:hypothetical protein
MRVRPFEELEDIARKRYQAAFAGAPEAKILNVEALVEFTVPRCQVRKFVEGGIAFRAPPLSFALGVEVLVHANALKGLLEKHAPPEFVTVAHDQAIRLLPTILSPVSRFRRLRGGWLSVFHALPTDKLEHFLRYLLHVPDESGFPPSTKPGTLDLMDAVVGVIHGFPGWVDTGGLFRRGTGLPRLWAHSVYGSRYLARERARGALVLGDAMRMAFGAEKNDYKKWLADHTAVAGW